MKKKYNILIIIFLLMLFSLINNYSASFIMDSYHNYMLKELLWYIAGFLTIFIISKFNINFIFKYSFYLYLFGNIILLLTLFIGTNINGSTSWLIFGPVGLQPSEFMKIALIIYLYEFTKKNKLNDFKYILLTLIIVLIPSILTFLEPDTGAVLIYFIVFLAFLITKKLNKWWYISAGLLTIIVGISFLAFYYGSQETFIKFFGTSFFYRMDRITNFIKGEGYQINKALISIGSSGLFGKGLKVMPEYFPEAPTDFAFALLIKNIGYIGILFFLIIYGLLFFSLIKTITSKNISLVFPIFLILFIQFSINVLMNIALFPIIGITLPFLSYGGSNLLSYMILIALVVNAQKITN